MTSSLIPYIKRSIRSPTAIVHLEYNPSDLEPVPSPEEWTRFVCISDTHRRTFDVPSGDVLLHSGDLTLTGTKDQFSTTMEWIYTLPHKIKVVIAGNHDLTLDDANSEQLYRKFGVKDILSESARREIKDMLIGPRAKAAGVVYLENEEHSFQIKEGRRTWSVYGSPWSPTFFNWAFNYDRGEEAARLMTTFPKTDILLTHGPAFGIFDRVNNGDMVGCEALLERLPELRPRIHLAGHIHEARGAHIHAWDPASNYAPPRVQNRENDDDDDDDGDGNDLMEDLGLQVEGENEEAAVDLEDASPVERTVFVNAANYPSGVLARRATHRVPFGGPGVQPIVVDLRDDYIPRSGV